MKTNIIRELVKTQQNMIEKKYSKELTINLNYQQKCNLACIFCSVSY